MVYYIVALALLVILVWIIKLALLYKSKSKFKAFWDGQKTAAPQANELVYFAIGDSAAQGIGARSPQQSYPYVIAQWLEKQTARPVRLINLSISGAKVADALKDQLPEIYRNSPPHIVTVAIGANDIKSFNAEQFESEIRLLARTLPKETYVANVPSFTGKEKKSDWKVRQAGELYAGVLKGTNHHPVDLYNATKKLKGPLYFSADWFHPNARAYKKWALEFEKTMAERIPELTQEKL